MFALFSDFGAWVRDNEEFVKTFLTIMATGLAGIAIALTPINLTAVAVVGLTSALALLWQDYQTWKQGSASFIDWAKWEPGFKAAEGAIKKIKSSVADFIKSDVLNDIAYRAVAAADMAASLLSGNIKRAKFAAEEFTGKSASKKYGTNASASPPVGGEQERLTALEQKYGLPSGLLDNVWSTESGRGKYMSSAAGAQGHFQFMPETAKRYGLKNPNDFNESSDAAARMYRDLLRANNGDVAAAAAAYNWGQGNLNRKGIGAAPSETVDYIRKVTSGLPGASLAAAGAGAGRIAQSNANGMSPGISKNVETHIGEVKVYTAATDADGIAKDMGKSLDYLFTSQANAGMS
jgi:soluble lytic murein transglycosylase-like protein